MFCLRMSADPLNCVTECYFCTYPPSLPVMIPGAHPPSWSSSFSAAPSLMYTSGSCHSVTGLHMLPVFCLIQNTFTYAGFKKKKRKLFNRLAVPLRTPQKLTKPHRWHRTSLTNSCVFPFSHLNILNASLWSRGSFWLYNNVEYLAGLFLFH